MSVDHGDFGRSAIEHVSRYYPELRRDQGGEYIRVNGGYRMVIGGVMYEQRASRTKPNTKWVRQHLLVSMDELQNFKVVEVNNWKWGEDNG